MQGCARCQHRNENSARFCEECAAPLALACVNCGRQLSPTAKFCPGCAHPTGLAPQAKAVLRNTSPDRYIPSVLPNASSIRGGRSEASASR